MTKTKVGLVALSFLLPMSIQAKETQSRDKFHAAMEACISENEDKLSGERPGRPGDELSEAQKADREIIQACLSSKGISKPSGKPPGGRGGGFHPKDGPPPEESDASGVQ